MSISISEDLVLGAEYNEDKNGERISRAFFIKGLTPGKDTLRSAAYAVDSSTGVRVPVYSEIHPTVQNMVVTMRRVVPWPAGSKTAAKAVCTYTPMEISAFSGGTMKLSSSSQQRPMSTYPSWHKAAGKVIQVRYYDPTLKGYGTSYAEIPVLSPNVVLEIARYEDISPLTLQRFRYTLNADNFQGGQPGEWLCRGIDGDLQYKLQGKQRWLTTYRFEWMPLALGGWQRIEQYKTPDGVIPDDIVSYKWDEVTSDLIPTQTATGGALVVEPYQRVPFGPLNLINAL